jgi:glycosyltransferase involved in cell wall biosynthesis
VVLGAGLGAARRAGAERLVRIVVDVTPLSLPRTGIGNYLVGMLTGLVDAGGGHEIVAFAPVGPRGARRVREALEGIPVKRRILTVPPSSHTWRTAWSRLGRPAVERAVGRLDAFHFSDWMYPAQRAGVRSTTVYDLSPVHHPDWVAPLTARMHGRKYAEAARTCDVVFAISGYTAHDVTETLGVPAERIAVAHPGVHARFSPEGERADLGEPFVLSVATVEPRKNLSTLVEAFTLVRAHRPELQLVVVGAPVAWAQQDLAAEGVRALGFVPDADLPALYRGASALAYPSLLEGFGIPVIEAMASGTPVVASSHPSLDDAAGEAAIRADPHSPEAIAGAIERAIAERERLVPRGLEHARGFTWKACAEAHLAAYLRHFNE